MARRGPNPGFGGPAKGVGAGDGWGGPPKGPGNGGRKNPPFKPGNKVAVGPHDMSGAERSKALKDHLFSLATTAEREETQVRACEAWLDREEGLPLRKVQLDGKMTLGDLVAASLPKSDTA